MCRFTSHPDSRKSEEEQLHFIVIVCTGSDGRRNMDYGGRWKVLDNIVLGSFIIIANDSNLS